MQNAVAFANNDVIEIAWSYGKKPAGCMGFAIYRIDNKGKSTPLPSHAVFKGRKIATGQTTAEFSNPEVLLERIPTPAWSQKRQATGRSVTRWSRSKVSPAISPK